MKTAGRFTPSRGFEPHTLRDGGPSRARFQPLLVLTACAVCLPALLLRGPGGQPDRPLLAYAAVLAVAGVLASSEGSRADARRRETIGVALIGAAAIGLVLLAARSTLTAPVWLAAIAAASVSMATIRRSLVRIGYQVALVVAAGVLLAADHPDPVSVSGAVAVGGPVVLLTAITVLASALAGDLELARRRELATRRAAERRAELLDAVRRLSGAGPEVADATVDALHTLGFPVAAVLLLEGDRLVPYRVDGLDDRSDFGEGLSGHALETGRTVVSADYRSDELRLPGLDLGSVVATPIVGDGRTLGVLTAGQHQRGAPPPGDVEVVEVLAAHLGGSLVTERVVANQATLLARLRDLDVLRASFVDRVTEDLRDPLTVVRGVAQTLAAHGDRLPDEQRRALLARLTAQATDLGGTLEALLDFSRVQVHRADPHPAPIDLLELLGPALAGTGVEVAVEGRPEVVVDHELVRRAVELLRRVSLDLDRPVEIHPVDGAHAVDLRLREVDGLQGGFARALAEQLLLAGGARSEQLPDGLRLLLPARGEVAV